MGWAVEKNFFRGVTGSGHPSFTVRVLKAGVQGREDEGWCGRGLLLHVGGLFDA